MSTYDGVAGSKCSVKEAQAMGTGVSVRQASLGAV